MINFSKQAWDDYIYWQKENQATIEKINTLIKDTEIMNFILFHVVFIMINISGSVPITYKF